MNELYCDVSNRLAALYGQWANLLKILSHRGLDEFYLEKALTKYQKAEDFLVGGHQDSTLYWDWANAWLLLSENSGEPSDIQMAIEKFDKALDLGCDFVQLRIDYGKALMQLGLLKGDPLLFNHAEELFKTAICKSETKFLTATAKKSWHLLALAAKKKAELSGEVKDFNEADHLFHEAILAHPSQVEIWLDWGELFLMQGWLHKDATAIETALEKLTSSKIAECNPYNVSKLLAEGLILLGLFIEDLKLIKDGESHIHETLKYSPEDPQAIYCYGLSKLALGLYYSDERYFAQAVTLFQKGLSFDSTSFKLLHALFQTYVAWGTAQESERIIKKGLQTIEKLTQLRPLSSYLFAQWGIALSRFYRIERDDAHLLEEAIAKIQNAIDMQGGQSEPEWLFFQACSWDMLGDHVGGEEGFYERAIAGFTQLLEKVPQAANARYHLALASSHLGECSGEADFLYQAHELFKEVIKPDEEDDSCWCEWGYTLLLLSECTWDPLHPEESEGHRSTAEKCLIRASQLGNGLAFYYLACLYSLAGHLEAALNALERAELLHMLPTYDELVAEEWLSNVRTTTAFQEFLLLKRRG